MRIVFRKKCWSYGCGQCRPLIDPHTDSLSTYSDADRAAAMERFRILQPHLEIGVPLTAVADASGHSVRTLRRWAAQYREAGLAG
ncbi:helix-turn-helix domain-containing protein [Sedimentitalea sp.]|uniref:helix-turn-helix domain-containing protein n=1 Tax=Sedimentitalea sp. TaxID=2048915 RepID=UPI0032994CDC